MICLFVDGSGPDCNEEKKILIFVYLLVSGRVYTIFCHHKRRKIEETAGS